MNKRFKVRLVLTFVLLFFSMQSWSQAVFEIKSPSKAKGFYTFGIGDSTISNSGWGNGVLAKKAVTGNLALAKGADSLAGSALIGNYTGKIAVIHRGQFAYAIKALNAQNAGAIAVIVINHGFNSQTSKVDSSEIFNLSGLLQGETTANATGLQVKIPVILVNLRDGSAISKLLRNNETVTAYLGGKQTYNYDLKIDPVVGSPLYRTRPSFLVKAGMVSDTLGMAIYNTGANSIDNVQGIVTVNKKGGPVLFTDKYTLGTMESPGVGRKDTLYIKFPKTFTNSADLEKGTYEINYKAVTLKNNSSDTVLLDYYNADNSVTTYFEITDSTNSVGNLTSYSYTQTNTNEVVNYINQPNSTWRTRPSASGLFKYCTVFKNNNVTGYGVSGIDFSAYSASSLLNKSVNVEVFEWNPQGSNFTINSSDLTSIYAKDYVFDKNYYDHYGNLKVANKEVVLTNNTKYLVCVATTDESIYFGSDRSISNKLTIGLNQEPLSPAYVNGVYYSTGFGYDYVSAISLNLSKVKSNEKELLSFKLVKPDSSKIELNESSYSIVVPKGTDLTKLVASFTNSPLSKVFVNGVQQISGVTVNNFLDKTLEYVVVAEDGSKQSYFVKVDFCSSSRDYNYIGQYGNNDAYCPNQTVSFYLGNETQGEKIFNFGNGKTIVKNDNYLNISTTYDKKGDYIAFVTYKNSECFNAPDTSYALVSISDTLHPKASFYFDKTVLCPNEPFSLNASNSNEKSYMWTMGDGTTYTENSINHVYKNEGDNMIKLTVTNGCGNTATFSKIFKVSKKASNYYNGSAYIYGDSEGCIGQGLSFYSSGTPQNIVWNFKDNSATSTAMQATHSFKTAGEYLVQATMTNYCGVDTIVSRLVTIKSSMPFTNLYPTSDVSLCPGELHNLYYSKSNEIKSVEWILPGNIVVNNNTEKSFALGENLVKVKLTNYCGNDTLLAQKITVKNNLPISSYVAFETYLKDEYCPGEVFSQRVNVSDNQFKLMVWSGVGLTNSDKGYANYQINTPGNYTINVKLTNFCGKDTTLSRLIKISENNPVQAEFSTYYFDKTYCPGQEVYLSYTSSTSIKKKEFDYGDNTFGQTEYHVYKQMGNYTVKLKLTNYCSKDTTIQAVVKINQVPLTNSAVITVYGSETAEINDYCKGDNVDLSIRDYSSNGYKSVAWNFGDGTTFVSDSRYTSHTFAKTGLLTVKATLTNFCGDTLTIFKQVNIKTDVAFKGSFDFNYTDKACPNETINFSTGDSFKSISWNFGDNTQAQGNNVSHAYANIGEYQLKVSLKNNCNVDTTYTTLIKVAGDLKPDFELNAFNGIICPGEKVTFSKWAQSKDYQFTYSFGDQSTKFNEEYINSEVSFLSHQYAAVGDYKVIVTAKNKCGLTAKDSVQIKVANGLKIDKSNVELDEESLEKDTSIFYVETNGSQFVWNFGGNNIVKTDVPVIKYSLKPNTTERVSVFVTTACGDTATFVKYYSKVDTTGNSTTGIEESKRTVLNVYPNPNQGKFTIAGAPIGSYTIQNQLGAIVHTFEVKELVDQSIQLDQLAKGMYFIVGDQQNKINEKIVIVE